MTPEREATVRRVRTVGDVRWIFALTVGVALLSGCGGSHGRGFVCRPSRGHTVVQPFNGPLTALGRKPVYVRIDNAGDLGRGLVMLGTTAFPGWFAVKTHFFSVTSYRGPVHVTVKRIDHPGLARLGNSPDGGDSFSAPASSDLIQFTWMRSPGCYEWNISGRAFHETVIVHATPHRG
jgi:hypothetical protein